MGIEACPFTVANPLGQCRRTRLHVLRDRIACLYKTAETLESAASCLSAKCRFGLTLTVVRRRSPVSFRSLEEIICQEFEEGDLWLGTDRQVAFVNLSVMECMLLPFSTLSIKLLEPVFDIPQFSHQAPARWFVFLNSLQDFGNLSFSVLEAVPLRLRFAPGRSGFSDQQCFDAVCRSLFESPFRFFRTAFGFFEVPPSDLVRAEEVRVCGFKEILAY